MNIRVLGTESECVEDGLAELVKLSLMETVTGDSRWRAKVVTLLWMPEAAQSWSKRTSQQQLPLTTPSNISVLSKMMVSDASQARRLLQDNGSAFLLLVTRIWHERELIPC